MKHHQLSILYTQHRSFGDVIVSTILLRKLSEKYKGARIDYYTSSSCAELLTGNPLVSTIYTERFPPKQEDYDIVLRPFHCLQSSGGWHLNRKHFVDLYAEACGLDWCMDYQPEFYNFYPLVRGRDDSKTVLLQAKTNDSAKDWSMLHWEQVALEIKEMGLVPVQIGGRDDPKIPFAVHNDPLPFSHVASMMNRALITVCLDSAVQHLAAAIGSPYIALYGAKHSSMTRTGLPYKDFQYAIDPIDRNGCVGACFLANCIQKKKCIDNIKPESVLSIIKKVKETKHFV